MIIAGTLRSVCGKINSKGLKDYAYRTELERI